MERFLEGKRRNAQFSLRAYASRLGISHSALSEILAGKRALTPKTARRVCDRLTLPELDKQIFMRAVLRESWRAELPDDAEFNRLTDRSYQALDLATFQMIAEWHCYALLCLLEIESAPTTPAGMAKRLGIRVDECRVALRRLERLGLLKLERRRWVLTGKPLSIYTEGYEPAVRHFMHRVLEKAGRSLDHDPPAARELSSTTLAIASENLPRARAAIKKFRRELSALLEHGKKDRVYNLSVELVPWDLAEQPSPPKKRKR